MHKHEDDGWTFHGGLLSLQYCQSVVPIYYSLQSGFDHSSEERMRQNTSLSTFCRHRHHYPRHHLPDRDIGYDSIKSLKAYGGTALRWDFNNITFAILDTLHKLHAMREWVYCVRYWIFRQASMLQDFRGSVSLSVTLTHPALKGKFSSGIEGALASTLNHDFNWKQL